MPEVSYQDIFFAAQERQLEILGVLDPLPADPVPETTGSIVLLGPGEPGFWDHLTNQPEWSDGLVDPIDRWSGRAISALAQEFNATPIFPFGDPPYAPFFEWALRSRRTWQSPVTLLVNDTAGLFVSFRGALALPRRLTPPPTPRNPCKSCSASPCRAACPVSALGPDGHYDLTACHAYLSGPAGRDCMEQGCAVRRACPISTTYGRLPEQSAYHMRAFHHDPAPDPDAPRQV